MNVDYREHFRSEILQIRSVRSKLDATRLRKMGEKMGEKEKFSRSLGTLLCNAQWQPFYLQILFVRLGAYRTSG